jgi:hypothetical protein
VKACPADRNFGRGRSAAGLHASPDSLYRTARGERQHRSGVTAIPLRLLPRRCPLCGNNTIIGQGRRRKQAHDQQHDRIWIRRGRCAPCRKTFTVLPGWSPPYGHYSFRCRQEAVEPAGESGSWEQSVPGIDVPEVGDTGLREEARRALEFNGHPVQRRAHNYTLVPILMLCPARQITVDKCGSLLKPLVCLVAMARICHLPRPPPAPETLGVFRPVASSGVFQRSAEGWILPLTCAGSCHSIRHCNCCN